MNCIEITNLSVNYDNQLALKNVNLTIDSGQMIAIIGQNGSGKSTLIKAILGLIPAQFEKVLFFGHQLTQVRSQVTYIPQRESIDWDFPISVYEVVEMGRLNPNKWWKKSGQMDKQLIHEALEKVGMLSEASKQIGELSGGQQQRVFLARALVQNTSLLIMDEPFSGVDIRSQKVIFDVLTELKNAGKTMLIVHHDLSTVVAHFDHVIVLKNELLAFGETEKVFQSTIIEKAFGIPLNLSKND
jgi:ABC-type Mn2+/Zn2+ transport system ATPase subunit